MSSHSAVSGSAYTLLPRRVVRPMDVDAMRLVRNEVREYMTRNRERISVEEQYAWWIRVKDTLEAYLFYVDGISGNPHGYGLVREENGRGLVSGGLVAMRGRGLGRQLFQFLLDRSLEKYGNCWLEVLATNVPARCLYEKLGFVDVEVAPASDQMVVTMEYMGPR